MSKPDVHEQLLAGSEWFDAAWYASKYKDLAVLDLPPAEHYLRYGAAMGRDPSERFSTRYYLSSNPDVAHSGVNPLVHFLRHGRKEGRLPRAPERPPAQAPMDAAVGKGVRMRDLGGRDIVLTPRPAFADPSPCASLTGPCVVLQHDQPPTLRSVPDVGVHAHVHYAALATDLAHYLGQIPFDFSLYVSVTSEETEAAVRAVIAECVPQAALTVRRFPNLGRDIAPFVAGFGQDMAAHAFIAHIHTKRSPHNGAKTDWRRQLLTHLMGTGALVARTMRLFEDNPQLGMVFPEYHPSLRGQISWGTNFEICRTLAARMGIAIAPEKMHLFPAGSMFWARSAALAPLWDLGLRFDDFPAEAGQVDGTPAHAIERLFGEIAVSTGHSLLQAKSDKPYTLAGYHPHKWPYPKERSERALAAIEWYRAQKATRPRAKVVVYTALTGGYERFLPHEQLDPAYDYVAFTDMPMKDCGFWNVRPIDYWHPDPVRMARYVKAHPHKYFADYEVAVWVDANVVVRGELSRYVERLLRQAGIAIGGIPHPVRQCIYEEADAVVRAGKDASGRAERQVELYRQEGYPKKHGLIETNLMVINLRHPASRRIMAGWWREMDRHSHRDQLSLNYVLWKEDQAWLPILDERMSLRDCPDFAYFGHGRNSGYPAELLEGPLGGTLQHPLQTAVGLPRADARPPVDIVVCVHNALQDVQRCLQSVIAARSEGDRILIVDDASGAETADYLDEFARQPGVVLLRNPAPARGYCVSANVGMATAEAPYVLLLNSDTVLPAAALAKMMRLIDSNADIGIVGPLSNAASSQSIPDIKGSQAQTAINALPDGMTVADMDALCERWSLPVYPSVPLVHGFCQLLRKSMLERIGGFNEEAFPQGYGEENDLCMRAVDAGYDLKVATDSFVFHVKSASYADDERRQRLMRNGAEKLRALHGADRIARAIKTMEGNPLLMRMREHARALFLAGVDA